MFFQAIENHSFKVSVEEHIYLSFIVYGQVSLRRKPELYPEACKTPIMMTIKPLPFMQRNVEEKEEVSANNSMTRKLKQLQFMNKEKTYQGFNVSYVTSMDTLREIFLPRRKEDNMPPLPIFIPN
jgi:hypothetical protein